MDNVGALLEQAIETFDGEIENANTREGVLPNGDKIKLLEIDTDFEDTEGKPYLKIINHALQDAYAVYLDTIVSHYKDGILKDLVRALKTGEFIRVNGVTRIVGLT